MSEPNVNDAEAWDDSLLIKSYDKSLKLAKEELARRIANATNTANNKKNNTPVESTKDPVPSTSKACETETTATTSFKVGDHCRATYEDGADYEAKIECIDSSGTCLIKYVGYGNIQHVALEDLALSWGAEAIFQQTKAAKNEKKQTAAAASGMASTKKSKKQSTSERSGVFGGRNSIGLIPPAPPMPPMLNELGEDNEHLSAMLMSWYMSGYYTGLYQGMKTSNKKNSGNKLNKK